MTEPVGLNVWHGSSVAGHLWRDEQDRIGFEYSAEWCDEGFPLSRLLPLGPEPWPASEGVAHAWFANLLPEGRARERIVRALGVADDDFVLLREIGGDCAGAFSILPPEHGPAEEAGYQPLTEEAFVQLLRQRGQGIYQRAGRCGGAGPRLSLAGAQAKCPVFMEKDRLLLPQGAAASSHILKFELPEWRNVPVFEAYLNRLAEEIGLPVPPCRLAMHGNHRYLLVERYDRLWQDGQLCRLHQEDFCQLAGLRPTRKYHVDGGPGFAQCLGWVREFSEVPSEDIRSLLHWQIFNLLAGNSDGHAKNLALMQVEPDSDRWRLAPFYDLVCTRALPDLDRHLAMNIGGESDPGRIGAEHWRSLARECGLQPRFVLKELRELAGAILDVLAKVRSDMEAEHDDLPMLQQPERVIQRQIRLSLAGLPE